MWLFSDLGQSRTISLSGYLLRPVNEFMGLMWKNYSFFFVFFWSVYSCVMQCPGTESDQVYILRRRLVFSSVFIVDCMVLPVCFFTKRNDDPFQSIAFTI